MQQGSPSGQAVDPEKQAKVEEEKKKLEQDLNEGKISQAEYFKKMQALTGATPSPMAGAPPVSPQQPPPVNPAVPQLPPAGVHPMMPGIAPGPPGPQEEVPPIGQALAVSSEDVEVVECYKCGGLITVTTKQRPVIIACPTCGTKGEVDASEVELEPEKPAVPKPTAAKEYDESKVFKFGKEEEKPKAPVFGSTLDEDLSKQEGAPKQPPSTPAQPPPPPAPSTAPTPGQPKPAEKEKEEK